MMHTRSRTAFFAAILAGWAMQAQAADNRVFSLAIEQHAFTPEQITVPAGTPFTLKIQNKDRTPEEFESTELKREKVIPGGAVGTVAIGPQEAGTYHFFGDFNKKTAKGTIVVQ